MSRHITHIIIIIIIIIIVVVVVVVVVREVSTPDAWHPIVLFSISILKAGNSLNTTKFHFV